MWPEEMVLFWHDGRLYKVNMWMTTIVNEVHLWLLFLIKTAFNNWCLANKFSHTNQICPELRWIWLRSRGFILNMAGGFSHAFQAWNYLEIVTIPIFFADILLDKWFIFEMNTNKIHDYLKSLLIAKTNLWIIEEFNKIWAWVNIFLIVWSDLLCLSLLS